MDTTLKVFIRIRWTSRYTQMELQHEYYSAKFLHPARRESATKACLKAQCSAQLRDICGTTLRARISHKPEEINFHISTNQQINKQHGPVMKFLAKWKGPGKEPPKQRNDKYIKIYIKESMEKRFENWSSFAWLRTVRCLWRVLQGGSAKLECCKLPWLHQPARCEKLWTMWDIMPIRLYDPIAIHTIVILMIQYDPMIVKLIESV